LKASLRRFLELLKLTYREWQDDQAVRLAAALAYYTVFSLAPLLVIVIGFLLLVSLVLSTGLAAMREFTSTFIPAPDLLVQVLYFLVSTGVIALLFALVFKYLPDAQIGWRDVWMGAIFTAVLFSLGKELIGLYLGNSAVGSAFGAAGSLALILLWVYYSAQILFFGAEFTQVYANKFGSRIRSDWKPEADLPRAK
jgi:membrane protein